MLGSLMGCSFESMVIDNEAAGMISRTLRGIEVSDDTLSVDVIHECAIDPGHFLGNAQTLQYMETEYVYPTLMDRELTDTWEKAGRQDMFERSRVSCERHSVQSLPKLLWQQGLMKRFGPSSRSSCRLKSMRAG